MARWSTTLTIVILLLLAGAAIIALPWRPDKSSSRLESGSGAVDIPRSATSREASPQTVGGIRFTAMTAESGIDFTYYGSPTPQAYMTDQNGGGVALVDFDRDEQVEPPVTLRIVTSPYDGCCRHQSGHAVPDDQIPGQAPDNDCVAWEVILFQTKSGAFNISVGMLSHRKGSQANRPQSVADRSIDVPDNNKYQPIRLNRV